MDEWIDRWMAGWMLDGCWVDKMDGWMDAGWMDAGWMDAG